MSPLDQAPAFRALMDRRGWSGRRLAAQLRLSPSTISRALALLDLPEADRDDLASGRVAASRLRPDRRDPDKPPPDPDPDAPAAPTTRRPGSNARPRRTFAVAGGRATLILDGPGGLTEFAELAVAVALQLMDEAKAAQT
jgi:transcriptional regulator with XRE-family HTH domain